MSMPIALEAPVSLSAAPAYQCRHVFTDGPRCGSRSLRKENFCYYHHTTRRPAGRTYTTGREPAFDMPFPEDRAAIQRCIGEVIRRISSDTIGERRAGLLLYALQIASSNLPKPDKFPPTVHVVEEITHDEVLGDVAPITEFVAPPHKKTISEILLDAYEEDEEEEEEREAAEKAARLLVHLKQQAAAESFTLPAIYAVTEADTTTPPAVILDEVQNLSSCPSPLAHSFKLKSSKLENHVLLSSGQAICSPRQEQHIPHRPKSRLNPSRLNTLDTFRGEGPYGCPSVSAQPDHLS